MPLFVLYGHLERLRTASHTESRSDVAFAATELAIGAPLAWFAMSRPMSDIPGLAFAVGAQALLVGAWRAATSRPAIASIGATRHTACDRAPTASAAGTAPQSVQTTPGAVELPRRRQPDRASDGGDGSRSGATARGDPPRVWTGV